MGKYEDMGQKIGALTQLKNVAYGDSFEKCGELLKILFPDGIKPEQYRDALGVVRVIDKLFRLSNRKNAFGESPWRDIAGYGILAAVADQEAVDDDAACPNTNDHAMMLARSKEADLDVGDDVKIIAVNHSWCGCTGRLTEIDASPISANYIIKYCGAYARFSRSELERVK